MQKSIENEVLKTIRSRRSIRSFLPDKVEDEKIKAILDCAIYAPSATNAQPWFFTVIQNEEIIKDMNETTRQIMLNSDDENLKKMAMRNGFDIFHGARTLIIVSGKEKNQSAPVDCAAATQNILLAAKSLDIASCWIGFVGILFGSQHAERFIELLKIPQGYKPLWAIALGYAKDDYVVAPERKMDVFEWIKGE